MTDQASEPTSSGATALSERQSGGNQPQRSQADGNQPQRQNGGNQPQRQNGGSQSEQSLGQLVSAASKDVSSLVRAEIQLAKTELRSDVKAAAIGAGMFGGAAFLGLVALLFLSATLAEGIIALGVPRWIGYLIVAVLYLVIAGILGLIGKKQVSKVSPPERTIRTVKDDVEWAKHPTVAPTRDLSRHAGE